MGDIARYSGSDRSYDPQHFAPLFSAEDRHFWFRARNRVIARVVHQITARLKPGYRVLEAGCGTGNVLQVLPAVSPGGTVIGMDLFAEGLQYARLRTSSPLVVGDVHRAPFSTRFDVIGLFDVLEHLPDDLGALRRVRDLLTPTGTLVLTVPAHQSLWSAIDEAAQHRRRYSVSELHGKLLRSGFRVTYLTQFMASLFPLLWVKRRLATRPRRRSPSTVTPMSELGVDELRIIPVVNGLLTFILTQEARLVARRRRLPIGTSLLAVAERTQGAAAAMGVEPAAAARKTMSTQ